MQPAVCGKGEVFVVVIIVVIVIINYDKGVNRGQLLMVCLNVPMLVVIVVVIIIVIVASVVFVFSYKICQKLIIPITTTTTVYCRL